jgi:uncharacterized membrane protein (GlpM family)
MIDPFWFSLAAKMMASAAVVVMASLVVERTGPFLGAMIATLPISAGPAYIFLAMEHGPDFIAKSSVVSLAVNAATAAFIVAYVFLAQRRNMVVSILCALGLWFLAAWFIIQVPWTVIGAAALNAFSFTTCIMMARRFLSVGGPRKPLPARQWWHVPLRAIGVMSLVGAVVLSGRLLGPTIAGLAALVPIVMTSLAVILHPRIGGPAAAAVLANGLPGMVGMAIALAVLNASIATFGIWVALSLALAVCLCWNAGLIVMRRRLA